MSGVEIKRHMNAEDINNVTMLLDAAANANGRPALSDHLRLDLDSGGGTGFIGFMAHDSDSNIPHAYAQISSGNDTSALEIVVHPDHRQHQSSIVTDLVKRALVAAAADSGGILNWWVSEPTPLDQTIAENAGMELDRTLLQMRRPLPVDREVEVETRSFVPGSDDRAWLSVNNRAFAGHGEQGGWTLETLRQRQDEPWFDAQGFRIYESDGRLAAFCWTKVHPPLSEGDSRLGEIYVIAVDPDFHGSGLGTQLTLAGLAHLAQQGIPTALLYVDAANTSAVTMYERLCFKTHSTNAAFAVEIAKEHQEIDS